MAKQFCDEKQPFVTILKMISMFLDRQICSMSIPTLFWPLCVSLFQQYGQICEFCDEKQHLTAILRML
jgi:hypothetical protein